MKKIAVLLVTLILATSLCVMGGCVSVLGRDGVDGKDGKDVSIYEIYEATNKARVDDGMAELSFLDFVEEYLSFNSEITDGLTSEQAIMNYSLLSGVSILTSFDYANSGHGYPASSYTYNQLFVASGVIIDIDREAGDALIVTNAHAIYESTATTKITEDIYMFLYGQDTQNVNYTISRTLAGTSAGVNGLTSYYKYEIETKVNGVEYGLQGKVVGVSLDYDLAVIQIEDSEVIKTSDAVAAKFSDDDTVTVGEDVYLVGQPGGYGLSCTAGIISKDSEYITLSLTNSSSDAQQYRVIRTDAAINGGNSGGAMYNLKGEIVGIVNAKDASSDSDNMGYALAGSMVKRVVQSMLDNSSGTGYHQGVYLASTGVATATCNTGAYYDELNGKTVITESVMVTNTSTSGLFGTQLEQMDYILSVTITTSGGGLRDEMEISRGYLFTDIMFSVRVGDAVTLTISRAGQEQEISTTCLSTHMSWTD